MRSSLWFLVAAAALPAQQLVELADPEFRRRFVQSYLAEHDVEPGVTASERATLVEAIGHAATGRLDEAVQLVEPKRGPAASAALDFMLGNLRFQQDRLDDAAAAYRAAVDKYPKFRRAWGNLAQCQFRQSDFRGAARAFARVIELGGGDAVIHGLLGVAQSRLGDHVAAESAFRAARMLAPDTIDWKLGLAESLFRQQRHADAAAMLETLIAEQPDRAEFWRMQAEARARLGQSREAAAGLEVADRLGGGSADNLDNLGDLYANQELFDLAADAWLRALRARPDGRPERALRGARYLAANGAIDEARSLLAGVGQALGEKLHVDDRKELLKLRARLAIAAGAGADEEAELLAQVVALDPLDGDALLQLGQHHARAGRPDEAIFCFERAAAIEATEADAKVRHAQLLVQQRRYADALPLLRRAQTLQPRAHVQEYLDQVERAAQAR